MPGRSQGGSSGGHARAKPGSHPRLKYSYDVQADVLVVENIKYSGSLFRKLAQPGDDGALYRLIQDKNGIVIISRTEAEESEVLDERRHTG
jgi:hypothetical protein